MRTMLALGLGLVLLTPVPVQGASSGVDSLSRHFRTALERAGEYARAREALTGEDSLVVVLRAEAEVEDAAQTLQRLAELLLAEGAAPPVSPEVAADYRTLVDALLRSDSRVQERIDLTRARLFRAEGKERVRLERELATRERRLSLVHRLLQQTFGAMASLGIDVDGDRARLIARVSGWAEGLMGRIQLLDQDLREVRSIVEARGPDSGFEDELELLRRRSQLYVELLEAAVLRLESLQQPTTRYRNVLVTHTGEFTRGLVDLDVARSLLRDWWGRSEEWLSQNGVQLILKLLVFLLIMAVAWTVARFVRRAVQRALDGPRVRVSNLLRKMLIDVSGNLVLLAGFLLALSQVGANLAPILAGVGVVGFIVGFALQETLANFAAGIMILFYRPYDVGDFVEVSGVFGKVDQMSLVSTTILTIDNQTLVVPNGKIWGDVIRNVTAQRIRRVDLEFGIAYSADIPKAEEVMMAVLKDHERVLADPEPMVKLFRLNDSSVEFICRPWVKTEDYWDVYWDVTREVKLRFDAADISIPFPQRDVHHYVGSPELVGGVPRAAFGGGGSGVGVEDSTGEDDV